MNVRWSRVLIVVMIIAMPILIFWEFSQVSFDVPWITDPALKELIIHMIAPALYATGWVFIIVIFATRSADTVESISASSKIIPMRMRLFYTVNALFLAVILVFPVVTPFVAVIAFASFGWRLTTFRVEWDSGKKVGAATYIVMILFAIPPALLSIVYIPVTVDLAVRFWTEYWMPLVINYLYIFSMALATALTFGSLIYFIQTGASEYDQAVMARNGSGKETTFAGVKFLQVVMFLFLLFLEWKQIPIKSLFYWAGLAIVVFIALIGLVRQGRGAVQFDRSYFLGYLLTAAFFVGELWHFDSSLGLDLSEKLKSALLIITAVVYIATFVYKFITYEEDEGF